MPFSNLKAFKSFLLGLKLSTNPLTKYQRPPTILPSLLFQTHLLPLSFICTILQPNLIICYFRKYFSLSSNACFSLKLLCPLRMPFFPVWLKPTCPSKFLNAATSGKFPWLFGVTSNLSCLWNSMIMDLLLSRTLISYFLDYNPVSACFMHRQGNLLQ